MSKSPKLQGQVWISQCYGCRGPIQPLFIVHEHSVTQDPFICVRLRHTDKMTQWQPSKCSIAQGQGKGTSESVTAFFQILFFHSFNGTIRLLELSAWTRKITLTNACCICQLRGTALVLADTYASDSLATAYDSLATLFHDWVMTVTAAASVCPLPLQYCRVRSRATSHCSSAIDSF